MKIEITQTQMNLMLAAVEHGFRACERGKNLESALSGLLDLYAGEPPKNRDAGDWDHRGVNTPLNFFAPSR